MSKGLCINKILFFSLFFVLTSNFDVFGQTKKELNRYETLAGEYYENKKFKEALSLYELLDSLRPGKSVVLYRIIVSYTALNNHGDALKYVQKGRQYVFEMPADFYLYSAKVYHVNYKFDEAKQYYLKYKDFINTQKKPDQNLLALIDRDIRMCDNAREIISKPLDIEIKNMGPTINSPYADYGPVISADESTIIFTSNRPNSNIASSSDASTDYLDDIYVSYKTAKGWSEPVNMGADINSKSHDAAIALSSDGQKLLIYRADRSTIASSPTGDIWISELFGDVWSKAVKLPSEINTKAWEPSASFSADERTLFFTSDRKGGLGGTDIYMVKKLPNGEWAVPTNLGSRINTQFDEDSPFMHPDGKTLYFASNGHKSIGGYDIFKSEYNAETKEWSEPENVGYPINTPHDDIYFSWSADGTTAYFSSYRKDGYGDVDIYYANVHKKTSPVLLMKGLVVDSLTLNPVRATITVTNNVTGELAGLFNSNSSTGKFLIVLNNGSYKISIESEGYESSIYDLDLKSLTEYKEEEKNIRLVPTGR